MLEKKGFKELMKILDKKNIGEQFTTAELKDGLTKQNLTSGAATGTIKRAVQNGLLIKVEYGIYESTDKCKTTNNINYKEQFNKEIDLGIEQLQKIIAKNIYDINQKDLPIIQEKLKNIENEKF